MSRDIFSRTIKSTIKGKMHTRKAIVIIGARQVGKTILIKNIKKEKDIYC